MEPILEVFESFLDVHDADCLALVQSESRPRRYKKGEIVIRAGEIQTEIPFLLSGAFWCYYADGAGKRHMECLTDVKYFPMTPVADLAQFGQPSEVYMETLLPTEAVSLPTEVVVDIVRRYPEVYEAMGRLVTTSLQWHRQYLMWNSHSVPERYQMFCEMYPELSSRLTKTAIASLLNTSLPVLTRALMNEAENK